MLFSFRSRTNQDKVLESQKESMCTKKVRNTFNEIVLIYNTIKHRVQIEQNWWKFDLSWDHYVFYYKQASLVWCNHNSWISTGYISPGICDTLQSIGKQNSSVTHFKGDSTPLFHSCDTPARGAVVSPGSPKRRRTRTCWGHGDDQRAGAGLLWGELGLFSLEKGLWVI